MLTVKTLLAFCHSHLWHISMLMSVFSSMHHCQECLCSGLYMKAFKLEVSVSSESLFTSTSGYDECFIFGASNLFEIKGKLAISVI